MKNGGSAFPEINSDMGGNGQFYNFSSGGMSLRDYFAGHALTGWLSDGEIDVSNFERALAVAEKCYLLADAMICVREEK